MVVTQSYNRAIHTCVALLQNDYGNQALEEKT